jgi:hypothetical protein
MKSVFLASLLGLLSVCFVSCATPGSGGDATRSLNHTYQDSRGLTTISLFDAGTEARGSVTLIGSSNSSKKVVLAQGDFERLWNQLDESKLSAFALHDDDARFNAQDNYVIVKGTMPGGTTTYVIPKAKASANVKAWVKSFRTKTGG